MSIALLYSVIAFFIFYNDLILTERKNFLTNAPDKNNEESDSKTPIRVRSFGKRNEHSGKIFTPDTYGSKRPTPSRLPVFVIIP